jgi:hypothetical protein
VLKNLDPGSPAWKYFGADRTGDKNVPCKRIELDALSAPEVIVLIEDRLAEEGAFGKVVPPAEELPELAEEIYRAEAEKWADEALEEVLGWDALKEELADEFMEKFKLENSERYIGARFKKNDALSWRAALKNVLGDIKDAKHAGALRGAVRQKVAEVLDT